MCRTLFLTALVLTPGLILAGELDAKTLQHGRRQVEQMLRDRPEMTRYPSESGFLNLSENDPQVKWAIRKFAGEDTGFLVYWEPKPPMDSNTAEHWGSDDAGHAVIRVAKVGFPVTVTKANAFDVMWSGVVFELLNITRRQRFDDLALRAWKREINREDFIRGTAKVEYDALRQLQAFASIVWRPWASLAGAKMDGSFWWTELPFTFEGWMEDYKDRKGYPWHPYGLHYDKLINAGK